MRCGLLKDKIDIYRPITSQNEFGEMIQKYKPYPLAELI